MDVECLKIVWKKMGQNKEHNILLRKLLDGNITESEKWQLEKASLDDPFLADAIEGYYNIDVNDKDQRRFSINKTEGKIRKISWYRPAAIAASLVILVGFTFLMNRGNDLENMTQDIISAEQSESAAAKKVVKEKPIDYSQVDDAIENDPNQNINLSEEQKPPTFVEKTKSDIQQKTYNSTFKRKLSNTVTEAEVEAIIEENESSITPELILNKEKTNYTSRSKSKTSSLSSHSNEAEEDTDVAIVNNTREMFTIDGIPILEKKIVRGHVYDEKGAPIIAAEIQTVSSPVKAISDSSGSFAITVTDMSESVTAQSLGYAPSTKSLEPQLTFELKKAKAQFSDTPLLLIETMDVEELRQEYPEILDNYITAPNLICNHSNNRRGKIRMRIEISDSGDLNNIDIVSDNIDEECQLELEDLIRKASFDDLFTGKHTVTFFYTIRF